jgi:hypothetical protein
MICSAPRTLTPAEDAEVLDALNLTAEQASQPTRLELLVEFELGRMGYKEYAAACERYGYPVKGE